MGANVLLGAYASVVLLFILTAIRGNGSLKNIDMQHNSSVLVKKKPFLKNMRSFCDECEVVKGFRTNHCPSCKACIPKYTRHSLVLNQCIGASNELLYMMLMLCIFIAQSTAFAQFITLSSEKM
jgi:hypothetical protein